MCHNRTYSDHLCTFILNDNHNTWSALLWGILNPIKLPIHINDDILTRYKSVS